MQQKIRIAIAKLNNTNIIALLIYVYYNAYLIRSMYFGCRILKLINPQQKQLIKIYEPIILKKLYLSQKFLRSMLYMRKSALGIGIMKPSTIIDTLTKKLYIRYKQ